MGTGSGVDSSIYKTFRQALNMVGTDDDFLAASQNTEATFREGLALNYHTSAQAVEILAHDKNPLVRAAIAGRAGLKPETFERLLVDEEPSVRKAAICNVTISLVKLLQRLAEETDAEVQEYIIENIEEFSKESFQKALKELHLDAFLGLPQEWVLRAISSGKTE